MRIIDWLRREYPGKWTFHGLSIYLWESDTHHANIQSHIVDAECEVFESMLHVYEILPGEFTTLGRMEFQKTKEVRSVSVRSIRAGCV